MEQIPSPSSSGELI